MTDLRDHSQPCDDPEAFCVLDNIHSNGAPAWQCKLEWCLGGREVTIDYEALVAAVAPYIRADHPELDLRETVDTAIDVLLAAIGDTHD